MPVSRVELLVRRPADRHAVHGEGRDRPLASSGSGRSRSRSGRASSSSISASRQQGLRDSLLAQGEGSAVEYERFGFGELRTAHQTVSEVAANWKILFENYNECLHCPTVHPELVAVAPAFRTGNVFEEGRSDYGVTMAGGGSGYTKSGTTTLPLLPGIDEHDATSMYGVSVFPNMFLDLTGTVAIATRLQPRGAGPTTIVTDYMFRPEVIAEPGFDPSEVDRVQRARRPPGLHGVRARPAGRQLTRLHARRVRREGRAAVRVQPEVPRRARDGRGLAGVRVGRQAARRRAGRGRGRPRRAGSGSASRATAVVMNMSVRSGPPNAGFVTRAAGTATRAEVLALGRVAAHLPAVPQGDPDAAFGVDDQPVGRAGLGVDLDERAGGR